jgi:UMF1 family MFS transporter
MCANVGFGASIVAMNAYLPSLASESPEVVQILHTIHAEGHHVNDIELAVEADDGDTENPTVPLISDSAPLVSDAYTPTATSLSSSSVKSQYDETLSRAISRISSRGIALGYAAGIILLIIALIPVARLHGSTFALRLAIGLSGLWWMFFTIPAALWLPGMDPSTQEVSDSPESADSAWGDVPTGDLPRSSDWNLRRGVIQAWKKLGHMLRWGEIKKLKNTFIYLAAWFLLSDGKVGLR